MFVLICVVKAHSQPTCEFTGMELYLLTVCIGPFPAETSSLSAYGLKDEGCQDALTNRNAIM